MVRIPLTAIVVSTALLLAGCLAVDDPEEETALHEPRGPWQNVHDFSGAFLHPGEDPMTFTFEVPNGTEEIETLLTWEAQDARLAFLLFDPDDEQAARSWHERDGRAYVTNTHPPQPGQWSVEVMILDGLDVEFTLNVAVRSTAQEAGPIEATFEVPPRNPARDVPDPLSDLRGPVYQLGERDFAEINLNMKEGDWFNFTWQADSEIYFNVHYHPEGEGTIRPIEHTGASLQGEFTANLTEVFALIWVNESDQPIEVTVEMHGVYRLHSMSRDV